MPDEQVASTPEAWSPAQRRENGPSAVTLAANVTIRPIRMRCVRCGLWFAAVRKSAKTSSGTCRQRLSRELRAATPHCHPAPSISFTPIRLGTSSRVARRGRDEAQADTTELWIDCPSKTSRRRMRCWRCGSMARCWTEHPNSCAVGASSTRLT